MGRQIPRIATLFLLVVFGMFVYFSYLLPEQTTTTGTSMKGKLSGELKAYNSQLGNATIRAELGRSTWTLLHTMAARYPEDPTQEYKDKVKQFIYLLSELYPCGQCATHFQKFLVDNPPELETQDDFINWLCSVHNIVNGRLEKPIFDCSRVKERWTCGCVNEV